MTDTILTNEDSNNTINKLDGIEILVNMAKSGKIDPWNIDIVEITDAFLKKILEIKQNNLRLTGRTLFFAAVLLRIKSNILEGLDPFKTEEEEYLEAPPEWEDDMILEENEEISTKEKIRRSNLVSLEKAISRRTSTRENRTRKVTLEDLIKQLRKLEEIDKKKLARQRAENIQERRSYKHFTPDDIMELAHEEFIEDEITNLQNILINLFEKGEKVSLKDLIDAGMDKIDAYIALLFLASRSEINLVQEEFYSDLYIEKEVS